MAAIRKPTVQPLSREFVQPEGYPDTTTVNQRVGQAAARLQVRGIVPQPNPLVTAWQVQAILKVLFHKGVIGQPEIDEFMYFTAYEQMVDLERLADEASKSPLVVAASAAPKGLLDT